MVLILQRCLFILIVMNSCIHISICVFTILGGFQATVIIIFVAPRFIPSSAKETLFQWQALESFDMTLVIFDGFLADITRYSRLILYISCPRPGICHFFKNPWFLLEGNGISKSPSRHKECSLLLCWSLFLSLF